MAFCFPSLADSSSPYSLESSASRTFLQSLCFPFSSQNGEVGIFGGITRKLAAVPLQRPNCQLRFETQRLGLSPVKSERRYRRKRRSPDPLQLALIQYEGLDCSAHNSSVGSSSSENTIVDADDENVDKEAKQALSRGQTYRRSKSYGRRAFLLNATPLQMTPKESEATSSAGQLEDASLTRPERSDRMLYDPISEPTASPDLFYCACDEQRSTFDKIIDGVVDWWYRDSYRSISSESSDNDNDSGSDEDERSSQKAQLLASYKFLDRRCDFCKAADQLGVLEQ
ncbi:hypothetical protein BZA70DRAFT_270649 [Myxozyma melibiosi]|uniref:Uncharacterized protein n=1 Tax=Myxozyma melibiosi TaxID=54550 RepID=A0ABR1FBD6_9ASCO